MIIFLFFAVVVVFLSDKFPRKFRHGTNQLYNDLRLAVHDSFEKMSGYTYFGIIDFDEFLIPAGNKTLKEMLVSCRSSRLRSSGHLRYLSKLLIIVRIIVRIPKINRFITSRISKSMKSRGFTETFPSSYFPIVINRFIFAHWVLIYFIMQSLLGKKKQKLTLLSF